MSNGVYILKTAGPEWRIAYSENIDSVYGPFNSVSSHYDPNKQEIKKMFGNSESYLNEDEAFNAAFNIADKHENLDEGVCVISEFVSYPFNDLT